MLSPFGEILRNAITKSLLFIKFLEHIHLMGLQLNDMVKFIAREYKQYK